MAPGAVAFSEDAGAFSEAAGAAVDGVVLLDDELEEVVDGAVALGGVEGACAQTGAAIANTADSATPLNRRFIVQPPSDNKRALFSACREAARVSFNG